MASLAVEIDRSRAAWWLLTAALAGMLLFTLYTFVGTVVLAVFIYYGTRPVYRTLKRVLRSSTLAASVTVFAITVPVILLVGYLVVVGLGELLPKLEEYSALLAPYINVDLDALASRPVRTLFEALRNPEAGGLGALVDVWATYLGLVATAVTHLFVAVLFAFFLLRTDGRIAAWYRAQVGADGAAYAYATAVDSDLETIYFSNVLLVFLVAGLSLVAYHGYNFLAPAPVNIPFPTVLALLTGLASLVPLLVGKVVYLPLVGYLAFAAVRTDPSLLAYPAGLLVVAFLFLDFIPMTFLLPEIAGRKSHIALVMFGYLAGTMLFGWYGLFLGPLLVVLGVQLVRIVFTELVHGDPVTGQVRAAESLGSDPKPAED